MRILIVEDEKRLAGTLADLLIENNYLVDISYDGETGLDNALSQIYDAVILDVMLPKINGFDLIKTLRKQGIATPVLMLTAKSELQDRVRGLNLGSDYYLTKPFESAELLACLQAVLRRKGEIRSNELTFFDIRLNTDNAVLCCGDKSVRLRAKELELMRLLIENKNTIISKETLLTKVWGYNTDVEGNVIEVYMTFLRKKLVHIKSGTKISAVRMLGYRLEQ